MIEIDREVIDRHRPISIQAGSWQMRVLSTSLLILAFGAVWIALELS